MKEYSGVHEHLFFNILTDSTYRAQPDFSIYDASVSYLAEISALTELKREPDRMKIKRK